MASAIRQKLPLAALVMAACACLNQSMRLIFSAICFCLLALPAAVNAGQDKGAVSKVIDEFLRVQIKGLPGNASYRIGAITDTERLPSCQNLHVSLPQGGRLWGKSNVVVRCEHRQGWTLYVPIKIRVIGNYLTSSRALRQGQVVTPEDIATLSGDLTELPAGTLTDQQQAIGRTLAASITAGHPLRSDLLRQAMLIQQGQTVRVVSRGAGFEVTNEGVALNNATQDQVARVRLGSGHLVNGIATSSGTVTVSY